MDDISRAVQNIYNQVGGYFSKTREKTYGKNSNWPETQEFLERIRPGQSLLDVGCGEGRLLTGLPTGVQYLGIDFSRTLIEIAREKYPEREFSLGDITEPSTWNKLDKYDVVCSVATLHHVPTREKQLYVLKMMRQATKSGGLGYLTVWSIQDKGSVGEMVEIPFDNKSGRWVMVMDQVYLKELVIEAGWQVERISEGKNLVVIMHNNV